MRGRRATVSARALSAEGETMVLARRGGGALENIEDDAQATTVAARLLADDADTTLREILWKR